MVSFDRAKASIGLSNFVEFYEDYRNFYENQSASSKESLANKLLNSNPKASSLSAQITRINYSCIVFSNKWEHEMLKAAIESTHPSITPAIRVKARKLLKACRSS
jgi:hypothetical protein